MLDLAALQPEDVPTLAPMASDCVGYVLDALDLALTPYNALAVGWTLARGEFDGLRVETPIRMTARSAEARP